MVGVKQAKSYVEERVGKREKKASEISYACSKPAICALLLLFLLLTHFYWLLSKDSLKSCWVHHYLSSCSD